MQSDSPCPRLRPGAGASGDLGGRRGASRCRSARSIPLAPRRWSDRSGMSGTITIRVRITGRVQGVWYRGWTVDQARHLRLAGWVRNRLDGSVEAVFSGPRARGSGHDRSLPAGAAGSDGEQGHRADRDRAGRAGLSPGPDGMTAAGLAQVPGSLSGFGTRPIVAAFSQRIDGRTPRSAPPGRLCGYQTGRGWRDHSGSSADRGFSEREPARCSGIDSCLGYLLILWKMMFGRMVSVSRTTVVSTSVRLSGSRS